MANWSPLYQYRRLILGVNALLDQAPAGRALFILRWHLAVVVLYLLWLLCFYFNPYYLLNAVVVRYAVWLSIGQVIGLLILLQLGRRYRNWARADFWFPRVMVQVHILTMAPVVFLTGQLGLTAGVLLCGGAVTALILFERQVVLEGLITATMLFSTIGGMIWYQVLPYAPLLDPRLLHNIPNYFLFYFLSTLVFALPHIIGLILFADVTLSRWKQRDVEMHLLATQDGLTGVDNRTAIFTKLNTLNRHQPALAVLMVDADHFKTVNDRFGHSAGDQVLRQMVKRLRLGLRRTDLIGRYGGEEFIILLPNTLPEQAVEVAERCRRLVMDEPLQLPDGRRLALTVSIGVGSKASWRLITIERLVPWTSILFKF